MKRWIRYEPLVIDKPPDYYQTIEQKLNAINYHENCNHLVDIGLTEDSPLRQRWLQVSQDIKAKSQRVKEDSEDSEEVDKSLDYKQIYRKWLLSEEGIRSTVDLANHYAIFRDLFPVSPPLQSVSAIEVMPQTPVYYFTPLVSLNAEFCVLESEVEEKDAIDKNSEEMAENQSNDIIVSPKCFNCPNVTIDSSAINGINSSDNCDTSEVSDEELSGRIRLLNDGNHYYTLCLISLDSHLGHESNVCHWMATNIHNKNKVTTHETVVQYLPVYGIRGLGYQRFVFMLYKHKNPLNLQKVDDFHLKNRSFNAYEFMSAHGTDNSLTPVGLSWFQTTWDYSSRKIYYDFLNMRCPHYEWIAPKNTSFKQLQFPARAPFNIYLDNFRDPKEMAKDVLLERLKSVNPYDYEKEFS
ncbi:unnamed protein product [Oppiella nova]|uniref:Uncharacterized protein n=1 Tax=Oppiella nova TaxID=334625 RepID=A0A7R9MGD7_9ACAR|nr:unnamed protein product [Oppiella nova]CAG2176750.1 unnamed protein product [Oppiella nova]